MTTTTRNIGSNKGRPRIWLEGDVLAAHGLAHGSRWNVTTAPGVLTIAIDADGKRKIAGSPARPIIDMTGRTVESAFDASVTAVTVTSPAPGVLVLTPAK